MKEAIDAYCLACGQALPSTPGDYCRCIFRSLAMRCRQVTEVLASLSPHPLRRLHVIGGGIRNGFLMQYLADSLGLELLCGPVEGTAMGNALLQARAVGLCGGLAQMRAVSSASVETQRYLPSADRSAEYADFLRIQSIYNNNAI